jgi:glycine betaine/proline transport system substrate-binding protein
VNLKKFRHVGLTAVLSLSLGLAACGGGEDTSDGGDGNTEGGNNGGEATTHIGENVEWEIVGIDPGAGIMKKTNAAIEEYGLDKWTLVQSSGTGMATALTDAIEDEEPIIVTDWTPHWTFSKFDLKYLEDPKGVYGAAETIHTIGRKGFKEDFPQATKVLSQFKWEASNLEKVMVMIQEGMKPAEAGAKWVEENQDLVGEWTKGAEKVDGKEIKFANVAWASSIASNNVMKAVLENLGFKVTISQVGAGAMFAGVAGGSADAALPIWLPATHASYWEKYQDKVTDLGVSMEGVKIGLVVPSYVEIDSIEDLKVEE